MTSIGRLAAVPFWRQSKRLAVRVVVSSPARIQPKLVEGVSSQPAGLASARFQTALNLVRAAQLQGLL